MPRSSVLVLTMALAACSGERGRKSAVPRGEGRLPVPGGSVWYKVSGDGSGTPVVLLHGGPGLSSYYLKPFEELGDTGESRICLVP